MPFWPTWLGRWLASILDRWLASLRAEQAMRDLGAATQAAESLREAEHEEEIARAAGEVAASAIEPDRRDYRD